MVEHAAGQPSNDKISGDPVPAKAEIVPAELVSRLRRALTTPLARLRQTSGAAGTSGLVSATEAAYISTALDSLEQLLAGSQAAAPLQVVPVELADILMNLLATLKTETPLHSLELALSGESPSVLADEETVTQVTRHMLGVAIALAPHGGPVRVSLRAQSDGALVSVRQHETLLPEEILSAIFDPFAVVPDLDAKRRAALLTLPLARRLVESHGGSIWAEAPTRAAGMTLHAWWPQSPTLALEPGASPTEISNQPAPLPLDRSRPVLLIVEGDPRMARYLRANAEAQGYLAHVSENEQDALKSIEREEPDALLLDGGLPGMEDFGLLARLRHSASAPILVLGHGVDPRVCARLLDAGAVDYIPRPFNLEELLARIRVALRTSPGTSEAATRSGLVTVGGLEIDLIRQQVRAGGRPIALSRTEYRLLRALAQNPGMVISHAQLLERVWGAGYGQESEFLWVYIRRLRRKLEPDPAHPHYILTSPGIGYRLAEDMALQSPPNTVLASNETSSR
jgi:two-component system, OmpR family, KDP operon response regulator KdpE